jgi:hypothetical protein
MAMTTINVAFTFGFNDDYSIACVNFMEIALPVVLIVEDTQQQFTKILTQ